MCVNMICLRKLDIWAFWGANMPKIWASGSKTCDPIQTQKSASISIFCVVESRVVFQVIFAAAEISV